MPNDSSGFFRSLSSYANEWIETKRKNLQAKPQTQVDRSGGYSIGFSKQQITQSELREVRRMRESGGLIATAFHSKALIKFGGGVEFQAEDDELENWLEDTLDGIDNLILDMGEDALWYPYSLGEIVETRTGDFSHIECIEPWTMLPETDEYGDIVRWQQKLQGGQTDIFQPEEIGSVILNKASGRDKTGISEALRNREEIEAFRAYQKSIREVDERIGFPFRHVKAGRDGGAQLNDQQLRRIRNRTNDIGAGETLTTGKDIEIDHENPMEGVDTSNIQERNMRMLATALGLPIELLNEGSDGLGSGMPAELRKELLALQNEADRRRIDDQFTEQFLRPIVKQYSDFDHTQDMGLKIAPFLDKKRDMAELISSVGEYMTTNEVREKLDMAPVDDEEVGESYRTPEDIETPEEEQDDGFGGLFSSKAETAVENELSNRDLAVGEIDTTPPQGAADAAQKALDWRDEDNPNDCGTQTGWTRANQLANRERLTEETINRMVSFFARHEPRKDQPKENCSRMMWEAWGGDAGKRWAESKQEEFENARENSAGGSGNCNCGGRHLSELNTTGWDDWERSLYELHEGVAHGETDKHLNQIVESAMPEFVKERMRDAIMGGAIFSDFEGIASKDLTQLREFMSEQLEQDGWTIDGISGRLQDLEPTLERHEAQRIARTESQAVVNEARQSGYEETGMLEGERFYWTGALDSRTSAACQYLIGGYDAIDTSEHPDAKSKLSTAGVRRPNGTNPNEGGSPLPLDELEDHVREVSSALGHSARTWTPHIQCRKTYVRHVE